MGGYRSGRGRHRNRKRTVEECLTIDASHWMREGLLGYGMVRSGTLTCKHPFTHEVVYSLRFQAGVSVDGCPSVRFYEDAATGRGLEYAVPLETTNPHFGGRRWWFRCPLLAENGRRCGRRVQKLYLPPGADYFGCRHCYKLSYEGRNSARFSALSRVRSIRQRLGGSDSIVEPPPDQPKGMWWRTYSRLMRQLEEAEKKYWRLAPRY